MSVSSGSTLEICASRSCGRTANAFFAAKSAAPAVMGPPCWSCFPCGASDPCHARSPCARIQIEGRAGRERGRCDRSSSSRERGRIMLVLEDPDSEPLDRLLGVSHGGAALSAPRHWRSPPPSAQVHQARSRPQGHQAGQYPRQPHKRRGQAHRLWYRLASAARTPGARAARVHRRARSPIWHQNRPAA